MLLSDKEINDMLDNKLDINSLSIMKNKKNLKNVKKEKEKRKEKNKK